ncbi:MAG TPA: HAMP domain-containing sensor histidine kinase, partial [Nitrososphaeraceae archaeon]|nr:HAMP domain-containing sensor histidine kinase [Nitrososphaeraceae archaeon]
MYLVNSSDNKLYKRPVIKESKVQQKELSTDEIKFTDKQLKARDIMQEEFINIAAHELRTPIQPILGLTEILSSKIKDTQQLQLLDAIARNAKRLQRLTDDILDITQIESHSLAVVKERFNLNDIIMNTIEDILPKKCHHKNGKVIKLLYQPKDVFVEADKGRMIQVISNLLSNAVKFTNEGSVYIDVKENDNHENEFVVIKIKDTGIGLDPNILPKLFSKFAK